MPLKSISLISTHCYEAYYLPWIPEILSLEHFSFVEDSRHCVTRILLFLKIFVNTNPAWKISIRCSKSLLIGSNFCWNGLSINGLLKWKDSLYGDYSQLLEILSLRIFNFQAGFLFKFPFLDTWWHIVSYSKVSNKQIATSHFLRFFSRCKILKLPKNV